MVADKNEDVVWLGCLPMMWQLFVTLPLFLVIVYGIIQQLHDAPQWLTICFWVYVPSCILGAIVTGITSAIVKAATR